MKSTVHFQRPTATSNAFIPIASSSSLPLLQQQIFLLLVLLLIQVDSSTSSKSILENQLHGHIRGGITSHLSSEGNTTPDSHIMNAASIFIDGNDAQSRNSKEQQHAHDSSSLKYKKNSMTITVVNTTTTTVPSNYSRRLSPNWVLFDEKSGGANLDNFGSPSCLSGNGSVLAVGAIDSDISGTGSGSVHVYERGASALVQRGAVLTGNSFHDQFGWSISLSDDGNVLAIGAPGVTHAGITDCGSVYLYTYSSGTYVPFGGNPLLCLNSASERFGHSISLSGNGQYLAVGAPFDLFVGGRVYVYQINSATGTFLPIPLLGPNPPTQGFGYSVSFSDTGEYLAVGTLDPVNRQVTFYERLSMGYVQVPGNFPAFVPGSCILRGEAATFAGGTSNKFAVRDTITGVVNVYHFKPNSCDLVNDGGPVSITIVPIIGPQTRTEILFSLSDNGDALAVADTDKLGGKVVVYDLEAPSYPKVTSEYTQKRGVINVPSSTAVSLADDGNSVAIGTPTHMGVSGGLEDDGFAYLYEWTEAPSPTPPPLSTDPPTNSPTNPPVTPPPTPVKTNPPTPVPTNPPTSLPPTSMPTNLPTASPTDPPTLSPTSPPTPIPTPAPTPPPTTATTSSPTTQDDNEKKFDNPTAEPGSPPSLGTSMMTTTNTSNTDTNSISIDVHNGSGSNSKNGNKNDNMAKNDSDAKNKNDSKNNNRAKNKNDNVNKNDKRVNKKEPEKKMEQSIHTDNIKVMGKRDGDRRNDSDDNRISDKKARQREKREKIKERMGDRRDNNDRNGHYRRDHDNQREDNVKEDRRRDHDNKHHYQKLQRDEDKDNSHRRKRENMNDASRKERKKKDGKDEKNDRKRAKRIREKQERTKHDDLFHRLLHIYWTA